MNRQEAELIDRIYAAFSAAPRPGRDEITPHRCLECDDVRDRLAPCEAVAVSVPDMEWLSDSLPLLSPKALRYYLPRYLEFSITQPRSFAREGVLYHLATSDNPEEEYWTERYGIFSEAEREVIAEYFHYRATGLEAEFEEEWLERALNYWDTKAE